MMRDVELAPTTSSPSSTRTSNGDSTDSQPPTDPAGAVGASTRAGLGAAGAAGLVTFRAGATRVANSKNWAAEPPAASVTGLVRSASPRRTATVYSPGLSERVNGVTPRRWPLTTTSAPAGAVSTVRAPVALAAPGTQRSRVSSKATKPIVATTTPAATISQAGLAVACAVARVASAAARATGVAGPAAGCW